MQCPHACRECALDPGPPTILDGKCRLALARPRRLQCLMLLARPQHELAPLGMGAARFQRTGLAVPGREADLCHRVALVVTGPPAAAPVPGRAGREGALPIESEVPQREAVR